MTFLPVVGREMGVLARRGGFYWARTGTALASLLVMGWLLALTAQTAFLTLGRSIFTILSWVGFVYAMIAGVHATADCISEEKRGGTLGLLFLTDLRSYDVVLGKLSASSLGAAYALLAIVPMISLGLLVGGVTLNEIAEVAAILGNTLFFSLSLGVFISTLSRNERQSVFAAGVVIFLLTVGPFAILFALTGFGTFTNFMMTVDDVGWMSLGYPMLMSQFRTTLPFGIVGGASHKSMLLHHLLGWAFLILSCVILPRFVHEVPRQSARTKAAGDKAIERRQSHNPSYRRRLLDKNAFLWLALREPGKPFYAWLVVLFFIGLFGWVEWCFPNLIFDMPINLLLLMTVHCTLLLWMASEVCQRLVQDRRAGALELMLSTPLKVREIAQGQAFALRRIFGWPVALLVLCEMVLAVWVFKSGLQRPGPFDRALTYVAASSTLVLNAWALTWVGQWRALRGKSVELVLAATLGIVLAIPWIAYITIYGLSAILERFAGVPMSYGAHLLTCWGLSAFWSVAIGWSARARFLKSFREYAANRFDSAPAGGSADERADRSVSLSLPSSWKPRDLWRERPAVFIAGLMIVILFVLGSSRKLYWRYQLGSEVRKVRNEGFPTSISEMKAYIEASNPSNERKDAYPALVGAGIPAQRYSVDFLYNIRADGRPYPPEVAKYLQGMQPQLTALRGLTNYGRLQVSLAIGPIFGAYGSLACMDYLVAAEENDEERAYADMAGVFKLIALLRHCGVENGESQALGILEVAIQVLQSDPILREDQLARLAQLLEEMDNPTAFLQSLVLSRAPLLDPAFDRMIDGNGENPMATFVFKLLNIVGSLDRERLEAARVIRSGVEVSAQSYPQRLDLFAARNPDLAISATSRGVRPARNRIEDQVYAGVSSTLERDAEFTARVAILKAALALRRAKLDGLIYTNLPPLLPKYLTRIPIDPFSGEPIRVIPYNGRREVYSVGANRVDDTHTRHQYNSGGDIVLLVP